jgi:hypothetical protein
MKEEVVLKEMVVTAWIQANLEKMTLQKQEKYLNFQNFPNELEEET